MSDALLSPTYLPNEEVYQELVNYQIGSRNKCLIMPPEELKHSNVAVYLRCSTDDQSVDSQMSLLHPFLAIQGYELTECSLYIDEGVSAKKYPSFTDRENGSRLMQDIASGKITHVFGYKVDRFFRKVSAGATWLDLMADKYPNVTIRTSDCMVPTNQSSGRQFWHMMLMISEQENESRSERTQGGIQHKQENLEKTSQAVFGWEEYDTGERNITQGRDVGPLIKVRPNWHEYAVRQWMIQNPDGLSYSAMARKLNQWNIPTANGRQWTQSGVRNQVKKPAKLHEQICQFEIPSRLLTAPFRRFRPAHRF